MGRQRGKDTTGKGETDGSLQLSPSSKEIEIMLLILQHYFKGLKYYAVSL
jgi:hypothetical protein